MKRISFKDSGGLNLTQAVLNGRKTMTRRAVIEQVEKDAMVRSSLCGTFDLMRREKIAYILEHAPYKVGEMVAIQQAYKDIPAVIVSSSYDCRKLDTTAGWNNKMFVNAKYMPHHIRITDVKVERLQLISSWDCQREGVYQDVDGGIVRGHPFGVPFYYTFTGAVSNDGKNLHWANPVETFAALIDKVSGRGTWDSNPLVWAYSFELVD